MPRISAGSSELISVHIFTIKSGFVLSAGLEYCGSHMPSSALKLIIRRLPILPTTQALAAFQALNERSSAARVWHQWSISSWWNPASKPIQIFDKKSNIFAWYCTIPKEEKWRKIVKLKKLSWQWVVSLNMETSHPSFAFMFWFRVTPGSLPSQLFKQQ